MSEGDGVTIPPTAERSVHQNLSVGTSLLTKFWVLIGL